MVVIDDDHFHVLQVEAHGFDIFLDLVGGVREGRAEQDVALG